MRENTLPSLQRVVGAATLVIVQQLEIISIPKEKGQFSVRGKVASEGKSNLLCVLLSTPELARERWVLLGRVWWGARAGSCQVVRMGCSVVRFLIGRLLNKI